MRQPTKSASASRKPSEQLEETGRTPIAGYAGSAPSGGLSDGKVTLPPLDGQARLSVLGPAWGLRNEFVTSRNAHRLSSARRNIDDRKFIGFSARRLSRNDDHDLPNLI